MDSILFYTSDKPGAAPFLRVPLTHEGLRYAGYHARYKGLPGGHAHVGAERALTTSERASFTLGYVGYPRNSGIPVGTERFVGDAVWSRLVPDDRPGNLADLPTWTPVPEGAPPPRAA